MRLPFSIERRTAAAYGSAVAVLIVGVAALISIQVQVRADTRIQRTYRVLGAISTIVTRAGDARVAERTFLLTGDRRELPTYRLAERDIRQTLAMIGTLAISNSREQERLTRMGQLVDAYLAPFDTSPGYLPPPRPDSVLRAFSSPEALTTRNSLRDVELEIQSEEVDALDALTERSRSQHRVTVVIVVVGTLFACLCIALTVAYLSSGARELQTLTLQLQEQAMEAEQANRAKSEFLATMSHELRTPLNAIAGYTELIALGLRGPTTSDQLVDLTRIQRSQRHLLELINSILGFARVEAGQERFSLGDVPLKDVTSEVEALLFPQVRAKGIRYESRCLDRSIVAWADGPKVTQILLNLLTNAVKFTDDGGEISIACGAVDSRAYISVQDTGCGIAPEKLGSIFEPFVQLNRQLSRAVEGVGLGLAISLTLARGMHGDLTVESKPDRGSTFTLWLPLAHHAALAGAV